VTFTTQATLAATASSFNDPLSGLQAPGTRICYKVVPFNSLGDAPATQVCGTPDVPASVNGVTVIFQP
jgi:hypothetical protein